MTDKPQIVGLGLATLDVLIRTQDMPNWEHGARFDAFGFDGGGPVGTAMCAAARLGARVGFVGTAGNDHVADLKVELLTEFGVDISRLLRRDQPEDQVVIVYVDSRTGERVFSGFGRPRQNPLRPDELDRDYILSADYLHLEGMHPEAALQAAKWMHEAGKPVVLDGSKTKEPDVRPQHRE
ncbi:MAG: carbohydrate kinase family protein, partial [Anaerolineae bacterium]